MNKIRPLIAGCLCLAAIFVFCTHAFSSEQGEKPARAADIEVAVGVHTKIFETADIKDATAAFELWIKKIGEKARVGIETLVYDDLGSLLKDFEQGRLDMVSVTPLDYLKYVDKKMDSEMALGGVRDGKMTRKYLLLVRKNTSINSLGELQGKSIAMKRDDEVSSLFLNVLLLRERRPEALSFFSEMKTKKNLSQPVLAVFFGQADACITTDISFNTVAALNPQVQERMKVIASSEELLTSVTFFRKGFERKLKERVVREAVSMKESHEGRQFMLLAMIDGVAQLKETDLGTLKELLAEYTGMKGKQKGRSRVALP